MVRCAWLVGRPQRMACPGSAAWSLLTRAAGAPCAPDQDSITTLAQQMRRWRAEVSASQTESLSHPMYDSDSAPGTLSGCLCCSGCMEDACGLV